MRRLVAGLYEYGVPQKRIDAAPEGTVYRHFAWFRRTTGQWVGEWAGYVPAPMTTTTEVVEMWQQEVASRICPYGAIDVETIESEWDGDEWDTCPAGGLVCLDVTQFAWPVGDQQFNRWVDIDRRLDWPEASNHQFIVVKTDTLEVIGNNVSHRPVRPAVPGTEVFDITGSPMAAFIGQVFGRFVWLGDRWGFLPTGAAHMDGTPVVSEAAQKALAEMPVDLDLVQIKEKERVVA